MLTLVNRGLVRWEKIGRDESFRERNGDERDDEIKRNRQSKIIDHPQGQVSMIKECVLGASVREGWRESWRIAKLLIPAATQTNFRSCRLLPPLFPTSLATGQTCCKHAPEFPSRTPSSIRARRSSPIAPHGKKF